MEPGQPMRRTVRVAAGGADGVADADADGARRIPLKRHRQLNLPPYRSKDRLRLKWKLHQPGAMEKRLPP